VPSGRHQGGLYCLGARPGWVVEIDVFFGRLRSNRGWGPEFRVVGGGGGV